MKVQEGVPFHGSQDSPRSPRRQEAPVLPHRRRRFPLSARRPLIEEVGRYNPCTHPHLIQFDMEKVDRWIADGAQPTDRVAKLLTIARENA